jgi:hypothetical protein
LTGGLIGNFCLDIYFHYYDYVNYTKGDRGFGHEIRYRRRSPKGKYLHAKKAQRRSPPCREGIKDEDLCTEKAPETKTCAPRGYRRRRS